MNATLPVLLLALTLPGCCNRQGPEPTPTAPEETAQDDGTASETPEATPAEQGNDDGAHAAEQDSAQAACATSGGTWRTLPSTCVDGCADEIPICGTAMTDGCDCGPARCWDGTRCIDGRGALDF